MTSGLCTLQYAVGHTETCPGERCPFWEEVESGCVVAPIERQLLDQPALAQHLLELRADLDGALTLHPRAAVGSRGSVCGFLLMRDAAAR